MAQEIKKTEAGATAPQRYMDPFTAMRAEIGPAAKRDGIFLAIDIDPVRMM